MVAIGAQPILWHIMNIYAARGFKDFVLALGYKGDYIKNYFLNYHALNSDFSVNIATGNVTSGNKSCQRDWDVTLVNTGDKTQTGGRLRRLADQIRPTGTFMLTYGDGVTDLDVRELLAFHKKHGKLATVTAVRPTARFGGLDIQSGQVTQFKEKAQSDAGWINGGFFVFEPKFFDYLDNDQTILEAAPMERLVADNQLMAYQHDGFWQCMDTLRERQMLEGLWANSAPWKVWND